MLIFGKQFQIEWLEANMKNKCFGKLLQDETMRLYNWTGQKKLAINTSTAFSLVQSKTLSTLILQF